MYIIAGNGVVVVCEASLIREGERLERRASGESALTHIAFAKIGERFQLRAIPESAIAHIIYIIPFGTDEIGEVLKTHECS